MAPLWGVLLWGSVVAGLLPPIETAYLQKPRYAQSSTGGARDTSVVRVGPCYALDFHYTLNALTGCHAVGQCCVWVAAT
jgi:hypothetical protein